MFWFALSIWERKGHGRGAPFLMGSACRSLIYFHNNSMSEILRTLTLFQPFKRETSLFDKETTDVLEIRDIIEPDLVFPNTT